MKLPKKLSSFLPYLIATLAGALLPLSLAPFNYKIAAFFSPAILLYCLSKASPKKSFFLGGFFGWGMFGIGISWIYVSIHDYGNTAMPLAIALTTIFTSLLGLFPAFMCYCLVKFFPENNFQRSILAFPVIWVLFEILRGWIFTGLPWLYIGYSQLSTHLSALAPLGGIWLVSWATVFVASLLYCIFNYVYETKKNTRFIASILIMLAVFWGGMSYLHKNMTWTEPTGNPIQVSLIQGNIPQLLRWDPNEVANTIRTYQELTRLDLNSNVKPDIIVWPESAIPLPLPQANDIIANMNTQLKQQHVALITGIPVQTENPKTNQIAYYNALIAIGDGQGFYFKQQLIPFGEYVPFEKWLRGAIEFFNLPMSSFVSSPDNSSTLLAKNLKIAPAICYEIAYPNLVRKAVDSKNGLADLIVTVSNDTWFGRSIGPNQHLEIAQFRALETGRYVLRATNTGLTAVINPQGDIQSLAPSFEKTTLKDTVWAMTNATPWVQYGMAPLLAGFGILLVLARIRIKFKK